MEKLSDTVSNIDPPESIEVAQASMERAKEGHDVINLGWGEPHFETPPPVCEALYDAVDAGHTKYTASAGIEPLRQRIAQKLEEENDLDSSPGQVIVTPGAKQAIFLAIRTVVNPGDEVLLPEPAWTSYAKMIELAGAEPVPVVGKPENRFVPTREKLMAAGKNPKALIVNTPTNPTGAVWSQDELRMVASVVKDRALYAISDEVYEHYTFDDREHVSLASMSGMRGRTMTVNGVSKSHAMTGWRLGYLHAVEPIQKEALKVHQHLNTCATSFVQHAAVEAFDTTTHLEKVVEMYQENRDRFVNTVPFPTIEPEGAFYCLLDVRAETDDAGKFAKHLLREVDVALTPGRTYGKAAAGFLRASLALSPERIQAASSRIRKWAE